MTECTHKSALVTGSGRRIGRAIALGLAAHGWAVAAHYRRSHTEAAAVVADILANGGRAAAVAADLADEDEAVGLIARASAAVGPLTCLVNNASVFDHDSFETTTRESWDRHMRVNLRAPFVLIQEFAHRLPEGAVGNVVNILDQRVWNLTPHFTSYTVSKAGLWTLTRTLALALAPRIRVNGIGPGPVLPSVRQSEAEFARQWSQTPLRRPTTPEEIADAVRFVIDTPAMTGQMIALDGGQHLGWAQRPAGGGAVE